MLRDSQEQWNREESFGGAREGNIKCLDNFSRIGTKVFACGSGERGKEVASSLEGVGKF